MTTRYRREGHSGSRGPTLAAASTASSKGRPLRRVLFVLGASALLSAVLANTLLKTGGPAALHLETSSQSAFPPNTYGTTVIDGQSYLLIPVK